MESACSERRAAAAKRHRARARPLLGIGAVLVSVAVSGLSLPDAFAQKVYMPLKEAWRVLGVGPENTRSEIKSAFRAKIREVHPDVTGDDGTMLQRVRDAYTVIEAIDNPNEWHQSPEEGLPPWAVGLLNGVQWSADLPSYAAFLSKVDQKALAVGELSEKTGRRSWGASWGKYSQQEANAEALRICRQHGDKCRLIYVGSGSVRVRHNPDPTAGKDEREWWTEMFRGAGEKHGFGWGWLPFIDPKKEKLVGYKVVRVNADHMEAKSRLRVPVFRTTSREKGPATSPPYYYAPDRPKEKIFMKKNNFKRGVVRNKFKGTMKDPRLSALDPRPMTWSQQEWEERHPEAKWTEEEEE